MSDVSQLHTDLRALDRDVGTVAEKVAGMSSYVETAHKRLDIHAEKIGSLEKSYNRLYLIVGSLAMGGGAAGTIITKFFGS